MDGRTNAADNESTVTGDEDGMNETNATSNESDTSDGNETGDEY